jgi:hypothetical protein
MGWTFASLGHRARRDAAAIKSLHPAENQTPNFQYSNLYPKHFLSGDKKVICVLAKFLGCRQSFSYFVAHFCCLILFNKSQIH